MRLRDSDISICRYFEIASLCLAARELLGYEVRFLAFFGILSDEIGEKEEFEDDENDKKLNGNDEPERTTQRHLSEAVIVEVEGTAPKAFLGNHNLGLWNYRIMD